MKAITHSKLKCLTAGLLICGITSTAQEVKFSGTADKKFDGDKIVIYNRTGLHDSVFIKDGRFSYTVPYKEPGLYMFYSELEMKTKGGYTPYAIMVTEPGTIQINANVENLSDSKVSGSKENALYKSFSAQSGKAQEKVMNTLYDTYGKDFVNNRKPDTADSRYKQMVQDYYKLSDANQKDELERLKKFVKDHPDSYTAVYLVDGLGRSMELPELEDLYASMSSKYKDSRSGKSIAPGIEARKITAIGKTAPDFTQPDTLGNAVSLSSLRGQYVLVDFWASWCGPCRAENPNLVKTFKKYKDKGFTVLGVSLDQPGKKEAWLGAIHKDNLTWTQVSDLKFWDNEVAVLYGVKAIPTNFLLDPQGKIIAKDLRGEDLDKKLAELFDAQNKTSSIK